MLHDGNSVYLLYVICEKTDVSRENIMLPGFNS